MTQTESGAFCFARNNGRVIFPGTRDGSWYGIAAGLWYPGRERLRSAITTHRRSSPSCVCPVPGVIAGFAAAVCVFAATVGSAAGVFAPLAGFAPGWLFAAPAA